MTAETLRYAIEVLNTQAAWMDKYDQDGETELYNDQAAYYSGLKAMLELIISEGYTNSKVIIPSITGHKIKNMRTLQ